MKIGRRTFVKLIPAFAIAVAGGSLWFLLENPAQPGSTTTLQSTLAATSTPELSGFPTVWNHRLPPPVNPTDYRLIIDGDIPKPLEFTLDDLYAMPTILRTINIQCVEGWDSDVLWEGILLSYFLDEAGVSLNDMAQVTITDTVGYSTSLTTGEITNWDTMIALKADGALLTPDHGYPARLVAPTQIGTYWIKCVARLTCKHK
jgi:DMSO/TMAO reductase YedYZ molybdopterin-dependent catalytic subunit